jgi:crotonobetainyl-CoA:carnitine CoA-transferase CaiB-like acyl-CoA transferase
VPEALEDPQTIARGMIVDTEHPRFGRVRQLRSPVRVGPEASGYVRAPHRGEHQEEVLSDVLGYDRERIAELRDSGAFGTA